MMGEHPILGRHCVKGSEERKYGGKVGGERVYGAEYEVRGYGDREMTCGGESPPSYGHTCWSGLGDVEAALEGRGRGRVRGERF